MAKHDVRFTLPERELGRADIVFKVRHDDKPLGTLLISNGSIVWRNGNKRYGKNIRWADLAELIERNGSDEKK